jgi:hypothetical protein
MFGTLYEPIMITDNGRSYVFVHIATARLAVYELVGRSTDQRLKFIDEWAPMEGWKTPEAFQAFCADIAKKHPDPCF